MRPITSVADLQNVVAAGGAILITDTANGDCVHQAPCQHVRTAYFEQKVVVNQGRNGQYFEVASVQAVPAGTRRCPYC